MEKERFNDRWLITARGYLLFLLAIILLFNHYLSIGILSYYIGIGLLITGGLSVYATLTNFQNRLDDKNIWYQSEGLADILVAILILIFAGSGYVVYLLFGLWAIAIGSLQLINTYNANRSIASSIWITGSLDGIMIILGILIIIHPSSSRTLEHSLMGLYLLIYSVVYLVESFQLKAGNKVSA